MELVYTVRISYALMAATCAFAFPLVIRGWRRLPTTLAALALGLLAVYLLALLFGDQAVLPSQERGSRLRGLVYIADLVVGLGTLGLIAGLWRGLDELGAPVLALVAGMVVVSLFALYQWLAQRFGWPLSDLNTAPNPNALTYGEVYEGAGIFGWERIRGTFTEPLLLASFLTLILPLALLLRRPARRHRRVAAAAALACVFGATILTASSLGWTIFCLAALTATVLYAVAAGRVRLAQRAGAALTVVLVLAPILFFNPEPLAAATGRTEQELDATVNSRKEAWSRAEAVWARRPLLGYGPGQSGVKLAQRASPVAAGGAERPLVLGSAQGVWAAAMIDAGLIGLTLWLALIAAILVRGLRTVLGNPTLGRAALWCAALIGAGGALTTGDRLELRVWVVFGLLLATTTCRSTEAERSADGKEA